MIHCLANQNDQSKWPLSHNRHVKLILQNDEFLFSYDYLNGAFVLKFPIKETCFFTNVSNGPLWNHWIIVQLWIDVKTKIDFKIMLPSIYHLYHFMAQHHPLFTTTLEFQVWCLYSTFFTHGIPWGAYLQRILHMWMRWCYYTRLLIIKWFHLTCTLNAFAYIRIFGIERIFGPKFVYGFQDTTK
jgi:hypothetical protein